jgi:hypothetical protein
MWLAGMFFIEPMPFYTSQSICQKNGLKKAPDFYGMLPKSNSV